MKNKVNRALTAKKKTYMQPQVERMLLVASTTVLSASGASGIQQLHPENGGENIQF